MGWLIWILFAHFVADFICQSDWMAQNKSKEFYPLAVHIAVYSAVISTMTLNPLFGIINGAIHFGVDYVTSRISSGLYRNGKKIHWFFVVIGFDQFIHTATLIYTWNFLQ